MTEIFSLFRLLGVLVSIYLFVEFLRRCRRGRPSRLDSLYSVMFAAALAIVSIFPSTVNFITRFSAMESESHGRIITLTVLSSLASWIFLFRTREQLFAQKKVHDQFIRGISLANVSHKDITALKSSKILVALPAYNEAENILNVVAKIPKQINDLPVQVVVVDDGSTDDTADIVREQNYIVVSNPINRGQGAASRLAYDIAIRAKNSIVVTMDADGQHDPTQIKQVISPILLGNADLVIGSRLLGDYEKGSSIRRIGITMFNKLINILGGTKITDCSSGFKAFRVESLNKVEFVEDQFQAAEVLVRCAKAGMRIQEVPITIRNRHSGESKKGTNLSYGLGFTKTILKSWLR